MAIYKKNQIILSAVLVIGSFMTSSGQDTLGLRVALETGLKNNFSIILQKNEAQIATNNNTPGNAGFLPSLSLNAIQNNQVSNTHQEQFSGTTKDITGAQSSSLTAGMTLNWTLFDGFHMFVNKKMLNILGELGENGTRLVIEGTVADIMITYYGIIQLDRMVQVIRDAVALSMQRKQIAEARLRLGAGSQLMLLQSTVDLNTDSAQLIRQLTALANAKVSLNRLLARDVSTPFVIRDSIHLHHPGDYDTLILLARAQNTRLPAARLNQYLMRLGVMDARSERYPVLSFTGGYSYNQSRSETGFLIRNQSYGTSYGLILSYTLFNGFDVSRTIKNARVMLNSSETEVKDAEEEIGMNILQKFNNYIASLEIVRMQQVNVEVARKNVTIAFEKYQLGSLNDVELREIQLKLIDAQYQLLFAGFEAKKSEVELMRWSGMLLNASF